jgi:pantetheine-phosphate adenylyltransferase
MSLRSDFRKAVYAGSFGPITRGHHDIIMQAARAFDVLYVSVGDNSQKNPIFTQQERADMIEHDLNTIIRPALAAEGVACDIRVTTYGGATASYMKSLGAPWYVRGLRMGTEFDAEYPVITTSKKIYPDFTAIFFSSADPDLHSVSSSLAREVCRLREDEVLKDMVSPYVMGKLVARMEEKNIRPQP